MNKDHDERLVGKGEYRDAMNVEVSSSDGSNVGSVQNILGNRGIGVEFWNSQLGGNWRCVGSIASEKDNKFYYFLAKKTFVWENSFENHGEGWYLSNQGGTQDPWNFWESNEEGADLATAQNGENGASPVAVSYVPISPFSTPSDSAYSSGNAAGGYSTNYGWMTYTLPTIDGAVHPREGVRYRLSYDVLERQGYATTQHPGQLILANATTTESTLNSPPSTNNVHLVVASDGNPTPGTYSVDWIQGPQNVGEIRLWCDAELGIRIANLKIEEQQDNFIMEYDTSKDTPGQNLNNSAFYNSVTPVFCDPGGEVLKFDASRQITAINIIDGLLFWTDNYSEPKKINIKRCIEGTDPSGELATTFVSNKLDVMAVEESHISVIKKSPKIAPLLRKENFRHKDKQYSADMRISSGDKYDTDLINSSKGKIHDFSSLSVGDTFRTKLISHESTSDPVILEWEAGDEVVLKEYPTHDFNNVEYRIKATLTNWSGNVFRASNHSINSNKDLKAGSQGVPSKWSGGFLVQ